MLKNYNFQFKNDIFNGFGLILIFLLLSKYSLVISKKLLLAHTLPKYFLLVADYYDIYFELSFSKNRAISSHPLN